MTKQPKRISCHKCVFFHVTWDNSFPYGCKSMGFKGKVMPSAMVYQASGSECLAFEPKETPADKKPR
jgi:hypothetical protein